jgi:methylglutaconyl-CoA hydratase
MGRSSEERIMVERVLCEIDGRGVATVWLNRPEVNNAYDGALIDELIATIDRLGREAGLRALVLRGKGRHFQAGADLAYLRRVIEAPPEENRKFSAATVHAMKALQSFIRPVVVLIHGGCFGGGIGLVTAADIAIATNDAVFALTETLWGIVAAPIIPQLIHAIGLRHTRRIGITGERFDAATALRIGLVHDVCPSDALDAAGAKVVDQILRAAPDAVRRHKQLIFEIGDQISEDALYARLAELAATGRTTDEVREGLAAFAEKRLPAWYPG